MGLRHPGPLWGAQLAWSAGRKAASVAAVNWREGPSDRRTQRKQDRPYRTLGHGEEFCFHSQMRICWKLLSGEMIRSDICFEGTTLPIVLDTLEVKGRGTDS